MASLTHGFRMVLAKGLFRDLSANWQSWASLFVWSGIPFAVWACKFGFQDLFSGKTFRRFAIFRTSWKMLITNISFNVHFGTSFDCCGSFMRGGCGNFSHLYVDCCWVYMAKFKPRYMLFRRWSKSQVESIARFLAIPCSLVKSLENHFMFILLPLLSLCCFASLTSSVHKDPTTKKLHVGSVVLKVSAQVLCAWDDNF